MNKKIKILGFDLPSWLIAPLLLLLIFRLGNLISLPQTIYKDVKNLFGIGGTNPEKEKTAETSQAIVRSVEIKTEKPKTEHEAIANEIFIHYDTIFGLVPRARLNAIFAKIKTPDDMKKVFVAFGTRTLPYGFLGLDRTAGNLEYHVRRHAQYGINKKVTTDGVTWTIEEKLNWIHI